MQIISEMKQYLSVIGAHRYVGSDWWLATNSYEGDILYLELKKPASLDQLYQFVKIAERIANERGLRVQSPAVGEVENKPVFFMKVYS